VLYGRDAGYPVGTVHDWDQPGLAVGSYSHFDRVFPSAVVPARGPGASAVWAYRRSPTEPAIRLTLDGKPATLDDYMNRLHVTGLLVARDDLLLVERYQYGRTDRDRFTSNSMVKSLVALLAGIAIGDARMPGVDAALQTTVPALRGTLYGATTLRDLLRMRSGIDAPESKLLAGLDARPPRETAAILAAFDRRAFQPGSRFVYDCADTTAVALAVATAVRMPLPAYLGRVLWQRLGAEQDASWTLDSAGRAVACYGFNATLRDWGRLGRLLADGGARDGQQIVPRHFLMDATTPALRDAGLGYGYQIWTLPGAQPMFALIGAGGQFLCVDPRSKLVMVQTAVAEDPARSGSTVLGLFVALIAQFGQ
jgi:CubicO group peptidase (beta-lactamase class C family)